jgi:long-chain acyl-CoA synthetase
MAHGAMSQSMAIVTAYDTLGEEGLRHSVASTKARAIYLEPHLLHTFIKTLSAAKEIEFIILNTSNDSDIRGEDLEILKSSHDHIQVLKFEDLRRLGDFNPVPPTPPTPEDLCCIMYTSGSTGLPKGVPIKHKAVVAAGACPPTFHCPSLTPRVQVAGITTVVGPYLGPGDTLLTYLPLAHIFEFVFENACMYWGGTMGYGSPRTLTDTSVRNCQGDIREFKPSLLIGIPAVWETVKKGITANVSKGGWLVRTMFWGALYAKK